MPKRTSGELLREARIRAGLTQAELGARAGITQSVVSAYEHDRRQPALSTLVDLVFAAGMELDLEVRPRRLPADRLTGPIGRRVRRHRRQIVDTAAAHGLTHVRVFGSVSRGEEKAGSDLDLLVELPGRMSLVGLSRAQIALEELVGVEVDLIPSKGLKSGVAAAIADDLIEL